MAAPDARTRRVLLVGTFDPEHTRARIVRRLLQRGGFAVDECRVDLWGSRRYVTAREGTFLLAARAARAYATLAVRSIRARRPDAVMMLYPGHFDVVVLGPIWRARGVPVVFDPLISLYDTIVTDRAMSSSRSPIGLASRLLDRLAFRVANLVLADSPEAREEYVRLTGVDRERFRVLWPGAFEPVFAPAAPGPGADARALFYGSFIALHGVPTIVRAAKLLEPDGITVRIVGDGQESDTVDALVDELGATNIDASGRIPLEALADEIRAAGVCLGIFGSTPKAGRVVPFKVFEYLAMARPVVTGDTPAARHALDGAVRFVPVGDPVALADAIRQLLADPAGREALGRAGHARYHERFSEPALTSMLHACLDDAWTDRARDRS